MYMKLYPFPLNSVNEGRPYVTSTFVAHSSFASCYYSQRVPAERAGANDCYPRQELQRTTEWIGVGSSLD